MDVLRGLVMVVMVLDHTRDFFFGTRLSPTDLEHTTLVLFFTRWVTHFCAPGFVLLAGAGAYLYGHKRTPAERRRFLFTRGLWLVVLELTVVKFGWAPEPFYFFVLLQVIWAIGWSMVLLAPLSGLSPRALLAIGAAICVLHNLLDPIDALDLGGWEFPWAMLHERHAFEPSDGHIVALAYPLVPWVGVMAMGFGLGELYASDAAARMRWLPRVGLGLVAAFVLVRGVNLYGDPRPWSVQPTAALRLMDFLHCEKYPPSLAFLLMTLGPLLLALWALERWPLPSALDEALGTFGRVPLFFYVAHLYLLRVSSIGFAIGRWGVEGAIGMPPEGHAGSPEWPLPVTYIVWALCVLALLYPSRWYAGLKARRSKDWWWLRYL